MVILKFLPHDAMLVHYILLLCPCRYSTETAKCKIMQTMPYNSPSILTKILAKFQCSHPQRGRQIELEVV